MATFEWGLSKWDIDHAADSLNKDLFGDKKMKKRHMAPDCKSDSKDFYKAPDSDDEQLSKKAKKRLKERMRKKKKKAGVTEDASHLNERSAKIENGSQQTPTKEKLNEGGSEKKKKRKRDKNTPENSTGGIPDGDTYKMHDEKGQSNAARKRKKSVQSDKKEASPLLEMKGKAKKRKKADSETPNDGLAVKKRKTLDNVEESLGEHQDKNRKRRNRKKKNNSKKNKYKHLALNSKNKTDSGNETLNGIVKNLSAENGNVKHTLNSTSQTGQKIISNSSKQEENDSQQESSTPSLKKKKDKRKKTTKLNDVIDPPSKEVSKEINLSKCLTPISNRGNEKEHATDSRKKTEAGGNKTGHKMNKQKLLNMLKNSTSDTVAQLGSSLTDGSSLKEAKRTKNQRNRSQSENSSNEQEVTNKPSNSSSSSDTFVVASLDKSLEKTLSKGLSNTAKELKDKATEKLKAARFRFINEQLYNCRGQEAFQLFRKDVEAFQVYHQGFQSQTSRWPVNPLDAIIKHVSKRPKQLVVADFGCGDARLSESVPHKVYSFDLVALNDRVTVGDMSKTSLSDDSIDIAVFCLSLMGTNLNDYLLEANRVLKTGGLLKIAEVASRFHNPDQFIKQITSLGFLLLNKRELSEMFYLMDFKKVKRIKKSPVNVEIKLKPCVYKKR